MKVLHVYKTYMPESVGGVQTVINQIAVEGRRFGVQSQVFVMGPETDLVEVDGHKVHRCRTNLEVASTPFSLAAILKLRKLSKEFDIIHYQAPYPFADLLHFVCGIQKPSLVSYQSDVVKQDKLLILYAPLRDLFLNRVNKIVATTPNYVSSSKVLAKFQHKTSIIPIGLNDSAAVPVVKKYAEKWKLELPHRFFLFLGVLRYYKGLHTLIEAARFSIYPIVIAGAGPEEAALQKLAKNIGADNVVFLGEISNDDKRALYSQCYAFVFPSHLRSEAYGLSLLEAAIYSKPLICCEIGSGMTYINIDQLTGIVVPPENPVSLHKAMEALWLDPDMASRMGRAGRERYESLFTAEKMIASYVDLYRSIM